MLKNFCYIILISYTLTGVTAQDSVNEKLLLKDFISQTTENNPEFRQILLDELYLTYNESLLLSPESFILDTETKYKLNLIEGNNSGIDSTVTLSKLFPKTGTTAQFTYSENPGQSNYISGISFSLNQDIAKNAFGKRYKLEKVNIERDSDIAKFQIIEAYEEYLASLVEIYFKWYAFYESLNLSKTAYADNLKLLKQIEEKRRMHIANDTDVNKAKLQLLVKEELLIELENSYKEYSSLIKTAIRYNSEKSISPDSEGLFFDFNSDFTTLYADFEKSSRTYTIMEKFRDYGFTDIEIKKRDLLPDISLSTDFSYSGTGIVPGGQTENSLSIGLQFSYSLDDNREKALYETSLIEYKKTILKNSNKKIQMRTELENLYNEIMKTKSIVELYEKRSGIAEAIVIAEKYQYSIGKSNLSNLLKEINTLDSNRYGKESAVSNLNTLIVRWLKLTDTLVK